MFFFFFLCSVADRAHGYVGADLNTVCAEGMKTSYTHVHENESMHCSSQKLW